MSEFLDLLPPEEALGVLLSRMGSLTEPEEVPTTAALGRVTAAAIRAPHPLPSFARSTVDGFAVRAADTFGASDSLPAYLSEVGEVLMGAATNLALRKGECALIHTGGMLPAGADAVVMVEHTQNVRPGEQEILRAVAVGENVLQVGEDVAAGEQVIDAGVRLRPAEIGGLLALGLTTVQVRRRPQVAVLSSGDEVVPPETSIRLGQVRDINTYTLQNLVAQAGGEAIRYGIIPDNLAALREAARAALAEADLVVLTAGSSVSTRDLTAQVINSLGSPGVLVHGVNVRPGKPTILGLCGGKPVIGLPGNPVSALIIAWLFVVPLLGRYLGLAEQVLRPSLPARLAVNLASVSGREDWVPVRLARKPDGHWAEPVFGKSNLIFTLARADGLIRIPPDSTGLDVGASVQVLLFAP